MAVNCEKSMGSEQASQLDNTILTRAADRARVGADASARVAADAFVRPVTHVASTKAEANRGKKQRRSRVWDRPLFSELYSSPGAVSPV